ncbi:MAG: hypothetical protein OEX22_08380, partial [Cyclobacteriaceae bacterium]|nr:hypothetical protein [Cyclobacteriaceae bacterium]
MKIFLLISVLFMMMSIQLIGQNLIDSRKSSYITYIYKIKDSELESLYKKDISDLEDSYYHSLVDSFYTDSTLQKKLDYGHYLFVSAVKGDLKIEAKSFNNTDVRVINNKNDLQIVVFSKKGERIANALVYVKNRKLKFDKKSGSYTIDKSNNFGVIKVFYDGNWSFYSLSRSRNNTFVVRAGKFLLFSPPLKYLWTPLRDLYRSIRYWEIPSFVYKITNLFTSNTNDYSNKFTGYIAFNKPKFKPGDTVKLKAFVVRKNGKPINKELTLRVGNYRNKYKSFGAISPYRKGAYSYEFVLHDSLDFTLDLQQVVMLQNIQNKTVIENRFEFEDYELKSTSYTLRSENRENRVDESMVLYAKGVDENDMNLLDARIKLNVLSKRLESYSSESIFIPDTLWNYEQQLDPLGETKIILPDSIFPPTSLGYKVEALFLNSNNEFHSKTVDLKYIHENKQFQFKLKNDSLYINYLRSGKSVIHTAKLIADAKDETIFEQEIKLPYKMVINPYIDYYYITDGENQNHYWIDEVESSVIPITYRTKDSVYISLENLHKIPIWYTIYAGKNRVKRGSKNEALDFVFKSKTSKPYFLSIQYLWGNEIREEEYSIPFYEKKLNITIDQPEVIYPGQIAEINIDVKNQRGEPVPNVDLTAYSYTNKFNNEYFSPEAPYLGEVFGNRPIFNTFSLREKIQGTYSSSLIWDKWGKQLGLDSIEYYNFLYPEKQFYKAQISTPDSSTQFAPFYMENGKIKPIHILYIDNIPIYYRGTNTVTNYSFKIDDLENHQLKIRTANKLFKIDSIALIHGVKNVFSFSNNINDKDVRIEDAPYILSDQEKRVLQRHLVLVDDNFKDNFAYIKQYDNVQLLGSIKNNWRGDKLIVGPFFSDSTSFTLMEKFTTHFVYEPSYEYQFHKNLLKMKYRDDFNQLNHYLNNGQTDYELGQVALTEAKIKENWKFHLDNKNRNRTKYYNPSFTTNGYGRLYYQYHKKDSLREMGIYIDKIIMLNKADPNFLRVYKGSERTLHQLAPDSYRLIFLLNNQTYFTLDSIHVLANGGRYLSIVNPNIQPNDSLIHNMLNIVRIKTGGHNFIKGELDRDIRQVKQLAYKKYHNPFDRYVTGTVTSIDDGSTMPGVNVVVKGTTIGTITDIDGNYMLYLP